MGRIRILFILGSLEAGGAERQLLLLLEHINKKKFLPVVVTYYSGGQWEERVKAIHGVEYNCLNLRGRLDLARLLFRLRKIVTVYKPNIIFGLMGDACTLALLMARLHKGSKVVWGLRASNMDFSRFSAFSGMIYRLNARLSPLADLIVSNSWAGKEHHGNQGYKRDKITVIPNGIDTTFFRKVSGLGERLLAKLGFNTSIPIVSRIGRIDPMKGYETFLQAAKELSDQVTKVHFLMAGGGPENYFRDLKALADSLGITDRITWLHHTDDVLSVYNASWITCSASTGEGFPNVVAESLSCEVLCAATDVGDSRKIIGRQGGRLVEPKDPSGLAQAMVELLSFESDYRKKMGRAARRHIVKNFSVSSMVSSYETSLLRLVGSDRSPA